MPIDFVVGKDECEAVHATSRQLVRDVVALAKFYPSDLELNDGELYRHQDIEREIEIVVRRRSAAEMLREDG